MKKCTRCKEPRGPYAFVFNKEICVVCEDAAEELAESFACVRVAVVHEHEQLLTELAKR